MEERSCGGAIGDGQQWTPCWTVEVVGASIGDEGISRDDSGGKGNQRRRVQTMGLTAKGEERSEERGRTLLAPRMATARQLAEARGPYWGQSRRVDKLAYLEVVS